MATIADKLKDPFGPYRVADLLRDRRALGKLAKSSGILDRIDDKEARDKAPVYFKGILEVSDPRWLSEDGESWLRQDLINCLGKAGTDFDRILHHQDYNVRVAVIGVLFGEPNGLETTGIPRIITHDEKSNEMNEFIINSINVHSYALSREYLSKFRALRIILDIVDKRREVPVQRRTPRWLVAEYIKLNSGRFEAQNEIANYIPRHVHRAEIYALFGRHSLWLLGKITKKKLVNKCTWERFYKEVEVRCAAVPSKKARERNDCDELERLWDDDDITPADDETLAVDERKREGSELEYVSDGGYEETYMHVAERQRGPILSFVTKRFRSQAGDKLTDTAVKGVIPKAFYHQQPIFPTDYVWYCSDQTCSYSINFHCLTDKNLYGINDSDKAYLRSMCWNPACDSRLIVLFHDMVELHYYRHLEKIGVRHVVCRPIGKDVFGQSVIEDQVLTGPRQFKSEDVDSKFEWTKPKNHRPAFCKIL
ncbi:hypothetical protein EW145_g862 [Phellinidium pouzarii]|uniref:Uncharacterized protein n=1 Tax=Phellinidium pouzarii TaxID=167371 RepID=A0A4S4LH90_9AGAM|nr:hypothetical protein EW145_g862 [Phellinidium pouzarii]